MAEKWADYAITAIWFSHYPHKHVAYVRLHEDGGNDLIYPGQKVSKETAIGLLKKGKTIVTTRWNYQDNATWVKGAKVDYFKHQNGTEYLRTDANATKSDNLDNLLDMDRF